MNRTLSKRSTDRGRFRWIGVGVAAGGCAAALALVPIGAGALTNHSTASNQIKACYKTSATLPALTHVPAASTCPTGYTALIWNQVGPKGPQGIQGPPGISVGTSGTSSTPVALNTAQTLTPVLSTAAVPADGNYYVNASVMLVVAQGDTVVCILSVGGNAVGAFATVGPVANQSYETIPLSQNLSIPAGSAAVVLCSGYTANNGTSFYDGGITATLINSSVGNAPRTTPRTARPALPPRL